MTRKVCCSEIEFCCCITLFRQLCGAISLLDPHPLEVLGHSCTAWRDCFPRGRIPVEQLFHTTVLPGYSPALRLAHAHISRPNCTALQVSLGLRPPEASECLARNLVAPRFRPHTRLPIFSAPRRAPARQLGATTLLHLHSLLGLLSHVHMHPPDDFEPPGPRLLHCGSGSRSLLSAARTRSRCKSARSTYNASYTVRNYNHPKEQACAHGHRG